MTQPRTKSGQYRRYKPGERLRRQMDMLGGDEQPDDHIAQGVWNGAGALFFLALLLKKGLLNDLLITLMQNGCLLLIIQALKVIGLDSVRSQHGSHGIRVLSHEIVI
jgi:hypothetical protein